MQTFKVNVITDIGFRLFFFFDYAIIEDVE